MSREFAVISGGLEGVGVSGICVGAGEPATCVGAGEACVCVGIGVPGIDAGSEESGTAVAGAIACVELFAGAGVIVFVAISGVGLGGGWLGFSVSCANTCSGIGFCSNCSPQPGNRVRQSSKTHFFFFICVPFPLYVIMQKLCETAFFIIVNLCQIINI